MYIQSDSNGLPRNGLLVLYRQLYGLSVTEMAEKAGMLPVTYGQIEMLKLWPTEAQAERLAALTEVPGEDLFPEEARVMARTYALGKRLRRQGEAELPVSPQTANALAEGASDAPDPETVADVKQVFALVQRHMMRRLSTREYQAIALRYGLSGEEFSHEEIATILDMTVENVGQVIYQAMEKLRSTPVVQRRLRDQAKVFAA